jgi:hypothetical protein
LLISPFFLLYFPQILDKGRFSKTDYYVDHAVTDTKMTLLVTDRRLVLMSHDLFGQWQVCLISFLIRSALCASQKGVSREDFCLAL